ncbi:hypothetical protein HZS_5175 [Henneguya salminicola]|nr:hypothetical protein HZS_5175 [Henneguya salminicola]
MLNSFEDNFIFIKKRVELSDLNPAQQETDQETKKQELILILEIFSLSTNNLNLQIELLQQKLSILMEAIQKTQHMLITLQMEGEGGILNL